jgi:hypothetical protein
MFERKTGNIYIGSDDNQKFFQGYLPGTARDGYTRLNRKVTNTRPMFDEDSEGYLFGEITIQRIKLVVQTTNDGEEWTIVRTLDGSITRR